MKRFFTKNWFVIAVVTIAIAQLVNTGVSIRNNNIVKTNNELKHQVDLVKLRTNDIISNIIHRIDLGVRGFALTKDEKLLDPYNIVSRSYSGIFNELETLLRRQGFTDLTKFHALRKEVDDYFEFNENMIELVRNDQMDEFKERLKQDKGFDVWIRFSEFQAPLDEFENDLYNKAVANYEAAMRNSLYFQLIIVFFSIPVLILIVFRIQNERKVKEELMRQVAENDRNFVFNAKSEHKLSAREIIDQTILNTRKASNFIKNMANNNYNVEWEGLNETNLDLNKETLAGNLINMREQLKKVKSEDEKRNWMNEGLASFSELVRNHQHDSQLLADKCVSFLTKYLHSQQASLFVLTEEGDDHHLQLVSCYAFDKKKWIEKRVEPGTGLVGQAFLEGETILLKEIPKGYTMITSGLGDATPDHLVIVPLKYDIQTVAIIELASFQDFEPHHVMFLQKSGEFLASAILNSQNTQKMKSLLDTARINEEQMRQREEEMRQNMEELQATQEELVRKEKEMQKRLSDAKIFESNF